MLDTDVTTPDEKAAVDLTSQDVTYADCFQRLSRYSVVVFTSLSQFIVPKALTVTLATAVQVSCPCYFCCHSQLPPPSLSPLKVTMMSTISRATATAVKQLDILLKTIIVSVHRQGSHLREKTAFFTQKKEQVKQI